MRRRHKVKGHDVAELKTILDKMNEEHNEDNPYKQLYELLSEAEDIAIEYANPYMNDAGGAMDCSKILTHIQECQLILVKYHNI